MIKFITDVISTIIASIIISIPFSLINTVLIYYAFNYNFLNAFIVSELILYNIYSVVIYVVNYNRRLIDEYRRFEI